MSLNTKKTTPLRLIDAHGNIHQYQPTREEIIQFMKQRGINISRIVKSNTSGIDYYYDIPIVGNIPNADYYRAAEVISLMLGVAKPGSRVKLIKFIPEKGNILLRIGWGE